MPNDDASAPLLKRARERVFGELQDHPRAVNIALIVLAAVATSALAIWAHDVLKTLSAHGLDLALGVLSLAGILAGFVGVVVVFGLQASAPVFVRFRVKAGTSLGRDWLVLISTGFSAAALSLFAAIAYATGQWTPAAGLLLAAMLLSGHCALRMLWLMGVLVRAVRVDDQQSEHVVEKRQSARRYTTAP